MMTSPLRRQATSGDTYANDAPTVETPAATRALALAMVRRHEETSVAPADFPKTTYAITGLVTEEVSGDQPAVIDDIRNAETLPAPPMASDKTSAGIEPASDAGLRTAETLPEATTFDDPHATGRRSIGSIVLRALFFSVLLVGVAVLATFAARAIIQWRLPASASDRTSTVAGDPVGRVDAAIRPRSASNSRSRSPVIATPVQP
jgi:hypothetical protein